MCTLTSKFDYIVVAIEESRYLTTTNIEEYQNSLEAHKQKVLERNKECATE